MKKSPRKREKNCYGFLEELHDESMRKKKGLQRKPRSPPPHKTPPRMEILLQIYQKTAKEFQRDITFQVYQELLGYGVVAWRKSHSEKAEPVETPTSRVGAIWDPKDEETPLDQKKRGERKVILRSGVSNSKLELVTQMVSTKKISIIV